MIDRERPSVLNSNQDKPTKNGAASGKKTDDPARELDERLKKLSSSIKQRRGEDDREAKSKGLADNKGMAYGLKIGSEFVSAILVGSAIGWVFDKWLGTTPFGLIVFLILGFAAGILNVMRATGQIASPGAKDADR